MSSNGSKIVAVDTDSKLHIFDGNGQEVQIKTTKNFYGTEETHDKNISQVAISLNGNRIVTLVTRDLETDLKILDGNGRLLDTFLQDAQKKYNLIKITADGNIIIASSTLFQNTMSIINTIIKNLPADESVKVKEKLHGII
jgi:WD40 repeat protein